MRKWFGVSLLVGALFLVFVLGYDYIGECRLIQRADVKFFLPRELEKNKGSLHELYNSRTCIAHGGGLGVPRWRNSEEAVLQSISQGFCLIEVDMLECCGGAYIGAHDWATFCRLTGNPNCVDKAMSYEYAKSQRILGREHPCTFEFLNRIMRDNKNLIMEIDKIVDYKYLVKKLPYPERLMVVTYNAENYLDALRAGIRYPVFCVWEQENIKQAEYYGFPILGVNAALYSSPENVERFRRLHEQGVTVFVIEASICDNPEFIRQYLGTACSGIYTEKWTPEQFAALK